MANHDSRPMMAPLAVRMRPTRLEEVVGQRALRVPGGPLDTLVHPTDQQMPSSVILWGPPGTGKTTLAHVIAQASSRRFVELSAITAGVKDVRKVMDDAGVARDLYGQSTVLFLDEIHRFSKAQQDTLLPGVERGAVILVAATTENPSFSVISPLLSRSLLLTLEPLEPADIEALIRRALAAPQGLDGAFEIEQAAVDGIVQLSAGDARRALTILEAAAGLASAQGHNAQDTRTTSSDTGDRDGTIEEHDEVDADADTEDDSLVHDDMGKSHGETHSSRLPLITVAFVEQASDRALLRYDKAGDEHYDVISAFIKSMRGSDPDAALHYLARMITAGEDPRFIARRMMIFASEDVGMADPQALVIATSAATAVGLVGMPEGRIILGHAVVYLATAPKSNAAYLGIDRALGDVKAGKSGAIPNHLRDAHYPGAKAIGHGKGYRYPHDDPLGVVGQQYLPDTLQHVTYYEPTQHGNEREVTERLRRIHNILRDTPDD